jgi:hypothetical protein
MHILMQQIVQAIPEIDIWQSCITKLQTGLFKIKSISTWNILYVRGDLQSLQYWFNHPLLHPYIHMPVSRWQEPWQFSGHVWLQSWPNRPTGQPMESNVDLWVYCSFGYRKNCVTKPWFILIRTYALTHKL